MSSPRSTRLSVASPSSRSPLSARSFPPLLSDAAPGPVPLQAAMAYDRAAIDEAVAKLDAMLASKPSSDWRFESPHKNVGESRDKLLAKQQTKPNRTLTILSFPSLLCYCR